MVLFRGYGRGGVDNQKQILVIESMHLFISDLFLNVKRYSCKMGSLFALKDTKYTLPDHFPYFMIAITPIRANFFKGVSKISNQIPYLTRYHLPVIKP